MNSQQSYWVSGITVRVIHYDTIWRTNNTLQLKESAHTKLFKNITKFSLRNLDMLLNGYIYNKSPYEWGIHFNPPRGCLIDLIIERLLSD